MRPLFACLCKRPSCGTLRLLVPGFLQWFSHKSNENCFFCYYTVRFLLIFAHRAHFCFTYISRRLLVDFDNLLCQERSSCWSRWFWKFSLILGFPRLFCTDGKSPPMIVLGAVFLHCSKGRFVRLQRAEDHKVFFTFLRTLWPVALRHLKLLLQKLFLKSLLHVGWIILKKKETHHACFPVASFRNTALENRFLLNLLLMQTILLKVTRHRRKLYVKRLHIKKCPARRRLQEKLRHKRSLNKQLPFLHRKIYMKCVLRMKMIVHARVFASNNSTVKSNSLRNAIFPKSFAYKIISPVQPTFHETEPGTEIRR